MGGDAKQETCPFCNSVHDPDAYSVGYFNLADGTVKAVKGEDAALEYARETGLVVAWDKSVSDRIANHGGDRVAALEAQAQEDLGLTDQEYREYAGGALGGLTYGEQVAWFQGERG